MACAGHCIPTFFVFPGVEYSDKPRITCMSPFFVVPETLIMLFNKEKQHQDQMRRHLVKKKHSWKEQKEQSFSKEIFEYKMKGSNPRSKASWFNNNERQNQ